MAETDVPRVRIGVDVGGTFTHAVAVAERSAELLAKARVPTTHAAEKGVAEGVVASVKALLDETGLEPGQVTRVAHSTTQATNALLEGDVARVGVLGVGRGVEGQRVAQETHIGYIELGPGRAFEPLKLYVEHVDLDPNKEVLGAAVRSMIEQGAQALVAASAFSVDDPGLELALLELAAEAGLPACATHQVSQLYGLRVRTRTAAVNAAILPRMLETARHTEAAVRELGIEAPLVVMRSDGGAMNLDEMARRPVLTLLSGPAAGVAAALMSARVADGVFVEVGGTSTDISVIQGGRPAVRTAEVGGHRLYLDTLDVRTVAVAGGSMPRCNKRHLLKAVGPRSAHIAGARYACFPEGDALPDSPVVRRVAPRPQDMPEYLVIQGGGATWTVTPACAANLLGKLPEGDPARGDAASARAAFELAGEFTRTKPDELAFDMLRRGTRTLGEIVHGLLEDADLDPARARLVGGGGGAGVWVPPLAEAMEMPYELVEHAEVISAIGAALALLQETVERTLVDPSAEDIAALRREAEQALEAAGADPRTIEVRVEADTQRGVLRAVAVGSHELAAEPEEPITDAELRARAAQLMGVEADQAQVAARTPHFTVYAAEVVTKRFLGLMKSRRAPWAVLDSRGGVRARAEDGEVLPTRTSKAADDLRAACDRRASFGDAGRSLPPAHLVVGRKVLDLSGLADLDARAALCGDEVAGAADDDPVLLLIGAAK